MTTLAECPVTVQEFDFKNFTVEVRLPEAENTHEIAIELKLHTINMDRSNIAGKIQFAGLTEELAQEIIEELTQEPGANNQTATVPESTIKSILDKLKTMQVNIKSSLGDTADDIVLAYHNVCNGVSNLARNFLQKVKEDKPNIAFRELSLGEGARPVTWLNITNPDEKVLGYLADRYKLDYTDLKPVLKDRHVPSSYRYADYLFACMHELQYQKQNPNNLEEQTLFSILGENYIITFSNTPSKVLQHVWQELTVKPQIQKKLESTGQLYSRILGACLHTNEGLFAEYKEHCQEFLNSNYSKCSKAKLRESIKDLNRGLNTALQIVQQIPITISALKEKINFFGAQTHSESLDRYAGIRDGLEREVHGAQKHLDDTLLSWQAHSVQRQSANVAKLTYLVGLTTIPATIAGIFGMNSFGSFALSSLSIGFACSIALVGILFFQEWKNSWFGS